MQRKILKLTKACQHYDVIMISRKHLTKVLVPDLEFSFKIKHNLFGQNLISCHQNEFQGVFMQKILKMTKMCQLYDVIMI